MDPHRAPREVGAPDAAPSLDARRRLYEQALRASARPHLPEGCVALLLVEVRGTDASPHDERLLSAVTTRLGELLNGRLRSVDMLIRSASCELAVLLTLANISVAAAFSERLRHPIEQALQALDLADELIVCMGLAANPPAARWQPEALIELADFRMQAARWQAQQASSRDWALVVDGATLPSEWPDAVEWPATAYITNDSGF